ncbi:hypothetical protein RSO67_02670 [Tardiphaga sp. 709]|nr:hypothetical protein RSO67_02670 [Tardiphaga sp. 709]
MKQTVELSDMKSRAEAIRWTLADVSLRSGMARSTAYQVVEHQNPKRSTHEALSDAILAEEIRLRDYLLGLHPTAVTPVQNQRGAE